MPLQLRLDWREQCKDAAPPPGSIQRFFKRRAEGDSPAAAAGDSDALGTESAAGSSAHATPAEADKAAAVQKRQRQGGGETAGGSAGRKSGILRFLQPAAPT